MFSIVRMDKVSDKPCSFDTLIKDSSLSIRAVNALRTAGYRSLGKLNGEIKIKWLEGESIAQED